MELKEEPKETKVLMGQPAILRCRIEIPTEVEKVKLQWSKDMFGLENSTIQDVYKGRISIPGSITSGIYDLHFETTEAGDDALYACHIELTYKNNKVESLIGKGSIRIIELPAKPKFTFHTDDEYSQSLIWHPKDSVIWALQDQKLRFSCLSKGGNPPPLLSWSINPKYEEIKFEKSKVNTINLPPELHNSNISCDIANKNDYLGAKLPSTVTTIRILYFDNVYIMRTNGNLDQPIHYGESVSFTCSSTNTPEIIVYYSWFIEYNNPEKSKDEYLVEKSSINTIVLKASSKHHHSRLYCILYSSVQKIGCDSTLNKNCKIQLTKKVEASHILNVLYPPKIKTPFENLTVNNIGEWVILTCDVDSNPPASVKWFKTQVGTSKHARSINWYFQTSVSNLIDLMTIDNLISSISYHKFQFLNEQDLDIYICEASASDYQKVYKYVIVAKEEEPTIKVEQPIIKVERDGTASLMCLIESWPKPSAANIKWYYETSDAPIFSTERRYFINKRQLMGLESKLYFKNVINSDYGVYICTIFYGSKVISEKIRLQPSKTKSFIYISIGVFGLFFFIASIIVITCICRKNKSKKTNTKKTPVQTIMLPSPTMDSCIENEIYLNRLNSLPGYQKDNMLNDSIVLPSNRCFIFHNQQNMNSKLSSSDSRNDQDEKSTKKGNDSSRSWDSGVGPDDGIYRNGQVFQNPRGSNCISPFSTLASSHNSFDPINQTNVNSKYWLPYQRLELLNQHNTETSSSRLSNIDNSNFNGSIHSSYIPPQNESNLPLLATSANQSFVCIPIDEYQQHMRILQESQGPPSLRSFSIASYSTNNGNSTFNPNYRPSQGNISPTEVSVKSNSTNSKI